MSNELKVFKGNIEDRPVEMAYPICNGFNKICHNKIPGIFSRAKQSIANPHDQTYMFFCDECWKDIPWSKI